MLLLVRPCLDYDIVDIYWHTKVANAIYVRITWCLFNCTSQFYFHTTKHGNSFLHKEELKNMYVHRFIFLVHIQLQKPRELLNLRVAWLHTSFPCPLPSVQSLLRLPENVSRKKRMVTTVFWTLQEIYTKEKQVFWIFKWKWIKPE